MPVIPVDVVLKEDNETFVFVVDNGKAAKKKIVTGINDGIRTEILSGLEVGDEYIIAGYHNLRHGTPVVQAGSKPGGKPAASGKEGGQ